MNKIHKSEKLGKEMKENKENREECWKRKEVEEKMGEQIEYKR